MDLFSNNLYKGVVESFLPLEQQVYFILAFAIALEGRKYRYVLLE